MEPRKRTTGPLDQSVSERKHEATTTHCTSKPILVFLPQKCRIRYTTCLLLYSSRLDSPDIIFSLGTLTSGDRTSQDENLYDIHTGQGTPG